MKAIIALEDGRIFSGTAFGALGERTGEIVFNTSMSGYQEILTDPSYKGQIVTMTYPLIGNYGINEDDFESECPYVEGFVVKEISRIYSNWRATAGLDDFLKKYNIIGVSDVDTRAITKHIRCSGAMKAVISTEDVSIDRLVERARSSRGLIGRDMVKKVTCKQTYAWNGEGNYHVVTYDFGVKHNILRILKDKGCNITVIPASTNAEQVLKLKPDGIFLSNGPGDPQGVIYAVEQIKKLIGIKPIFGICLGHQLIALALGGATYKLKFGHRGGNQPVKNLRTHKVEISSQNHGFCVDINSLDKNEIEITHINLNDNTLEGIKHRKFPLFSVQYHPESSPGPHDSAYLFDEFITMMKEYRFVNSDGVRNEM